MDFGSLRVLHLFSEKATIVIHAVGARGLQPMMESKPLETERVVLKQYPERPEGLCRVKSQKSST